MTERNRSCAGARANPRRLRTVIRPTVGPMLGRPVRAALRRIRTLVAIATIAGIALVAAPAAAADALTPAPCPPQIEAAVRAALPTSAAPACRLHRTVTRVVDGKAIAGVLDKVEADVVLGDGRMATVELAPDGKVLGMTYAHDDLIGSSGKATALMFWAFALISVVGALFVVSRRNLIVAVMGMVGSFLGIAALYMMLYAQFLAVIQMLVYAGAIMVLFVFVVMILNRPEDEPVAPSGRAGQVVGGLGILYLVARLVMMLVQVQPPNPAIAMAAPPPLPEHCVAWQGNACVKTDRYDWGSVGAVGSDLFAAGLFPFEAISILLLLSVVGAIAIARPLHQEEDAPARARAEGGVA